MALDRNCRAIPYIAGRMIAITEHYAGKKFGPNTLSNMFTHPAHGIDVFRRYIDENDEYYQELNDVEIPVTITNEVEKGQIWVGYYHQKAAYDDTTHGGYRPNSGRPATDRKVMLSVRISQEAADKIATVKNKAEFIDNLIKKSL